MNLLRFSYSFSQSGLEVVKYQVGVLLRHVAQVGDVVPHDHVGDVEVGGGAVGQVADDQAVGLAAMLVHHQEVGHVISATRLQQLFELVVAPVESLRVRHDQTEFFGEAFQSGRRVAGGRDHHLGVLDAGPPVFVVLAVHGGGAARAGADTLGHGGSGVVKLGRPGQIEGIASEVAVDEAVLVDGPLQSVLLILDGLLPLLHPFTIEVFTAKSGLATKLKTKKKPYRNRNGKSFTESHHIEYRPARNGL